MSRPLDREIETLRVMIGIYCRSVHRTAVLCDSCRELADYAQQRVRRCPYGDAKPACNHCPIHCYEPRMRARMIEVMRFAGPKMIWRHPVLAIRHMIRKNPKTIIKKE